MLRLIVAELDWLKRALSDKTRYESISDQAGAELSAKTGAFTEKRLKPLAAKIEAEEYFPSEIMGYTI
jgi:hypothetical protein